MRKTLPLFAVAMFVAATSFAQYIVALKDGTTYAAKAKWTVKNGKAIVALKNGQSLSLDPSLIDVKKSEELTKLGLANANFIDLTPNVTAPQPKAQEPSLGSQIKLRQPGAAKPATPARAVAEAAPVHSGGGAMPQAVLDKFELAYENVGIFDRKVTASGARNIRAEVTVDTEERVFNAISATSFLMVRNAGVDNAQIDMVELFMKTTTGGAAGRFQMTRADAQAIDNRTISQQEYFVRKVIY